MTEQTGCCDPGSDILRADLDEIALRLATAGFAALWRGHALGPAELFADDPDAAAEAVIAMADRGRAEVDSRGRLIGIHGLTLRATRHSFEHRGTRRHTWCAFDSVGIPAALGFDATARTDCLACGAPLTVEVRHGRVDADGSVLWLPTPENTSHLMNDFCAAADLYCSPEHLQQRLDPETALGRATALREAVALGCETWADVVASDLAGSDYRRQAAR